ncbi:DoxX family protein [Paenibacillus sp. ACRRY]|uniref:DoxX family protein n=1 Tax=Paenibacillus sp. ACRRY TaxID=2918208 RepID=UPI001EF58528|nr:DoxX family protein [Paenibacillus sp. ACRRY]MCG7381617.1 DoxX family protein [Paenibacillus sp. ACRRY]
MFILVTAIQVILCVIFLFTGSKIISGQMADEFKRFGLPSFFNILTGLFELVGAVGMVIGIWIPVIALWAGLLLGGTMLAAAFTLVVLAKDPFQKAIPAIVLFVLSLSVSIIHLF